MVQRLMWLSAASPGQTGEECSSSDHITLRLEVERNKRLAEVDVTNGTSISDLAVRPGHWARWRGPAAAWWAGVARRAGLTAACPWALGAAPGRPPSPRPTGDAPGFGPRGAGPPLSPPRRRGAFGCPRGPQPPDTKQSANTTSPGCAPAWRRGAVGSGACSAWAGASAPAAPSAPAGCPPGGTPPP